MYGAFADARERKTPHYGRGQVLLAGVVLGTFCFLLHGASHVWDDCAYLDSFLYHFIVQWLYAGCFAAMFPVLDGMTLEYLQRRDGDSMDYGKERLYGAVSWGVTNLLFGPLIDKFGFAVAYPCAIAAALYSVVTIVTYSRAQAASSTMRPIPLGSQDHRYMEDMRGNGYNNCNNAENKDTQGPSTVSLLFCVVGTIYGAAFILCYFLLSTGFSVVENLVFLFFEFLGGSNTICAITVALTVLFEIPIFHLAPSLLRKHGVGWLLLLANIAFLIRIMGYTLIPQGQPWLVFLLEPLHGFTYACSQSAAVEYINQHMPAGAEASGQGIVGLIRGSGGVVGLLLGGVLQDTFGPRVMYRVFATAVTIGMAIFATVRGRYRQEENYEQLVEVHLTV
jgi:hypothetical protein